MAQMIELSGKHAVGSHRYTIVDDDMVAFVRRYRWKAKPNAGGNNVYAVRNAVVDGKNVTLRLHRMVLGLEPSDPMDGEHRNQWSLDNRRSNLRPTNRSVNIKNARRVHRVGSCSVCCARVERMVSAVVSARRPMRCDHCRHA